MNGYANTCHTRESGRPVSGPRRAAQLEERGERQAADPDAIVESRILAFARLTSARRARAAPQTPRVAGQFQIRGVDSRSRYSTSLLCSAESRGANME